MLMMYCSSLLRKVSFCHEDQQKMQRAKIQKIYNGAILKIRSSNLQAQ